MIDLERIDKRALFQALFASLERERDVVVAAQKQTQAGATHEENRPEGDKDTRATEASYLARGQAQRVAQLSEELARLRSMELRNFRDEDPVMASALVLLDCDSVQSVVFMAPSGGGFTTDALGKTVRVITPSSPLGRALLGQRVGDVIEVRGPTTREHEILSVR